MDQTEREKRLARLGELRQLREEVASSGGFGADDAGTAFVEDWIQQRQPGGPAAGGRLRERTSRPQAAGTGSRPGIKGAKTESADRPILKMLIERRLGGSAGGGIGGSGGLQGDDADPQSRRERLKRLIALIDKNGRDG